MGEYFLIFTECVKCGYDISLFPDEDYIPLCEECGGTGVRRD